MNLPLPSSGPKRVVRERVPITQSFGFHASGMEEETGALSGQIGIVGMEL